MSAELITIGLFDGADEAVAFGRRLGALTGLKVADLHATDRASDPKSER